MTSNNEELKRIYNLFSDCWRFFKKHIVDVQDTDQYWEKIIAESGELSKKYDNERFAIELMAAVVKELDRKAALTRSGVEE